MKSVNIRTVLLGLLLLCALAINLTGCATTQTSDDTQNSVASPADTTLPDTTKGTKSAPTSPTVFNNAFLSSQAEFALKLFQEAVSESDGANVLISPLSVQLALAMAANGAEGQTKAEMETLLGGTLSLEELNEQLSSYVNSLPSEDGYQLHIVNSVWFRDDSDRLTVEQDFLRINAEHYNAQIFQSAFDDRTADDINAWVRERTHGMIDNIVREIPYEAVMYLINALSFDATWAKVYTLEDISDGTFTSASGQQQPAQMMSSTESRYFKTENAIGFFKDYKDSAYSFVGILPKEGFSLQEYIHGLDADELYKTLQNSKTASVSVTMPKFSVTCELAMNQCLKVLGMPTAFDHSAADFSRLGHSTCGNIYISEVLHKTFLSVDELGTKAGAVIKVVFADGITECELAIRLDRPFLYLIVDNATNLPLLIGMVNDIK